MISEMNGPVDRLRAAAEAPSENIADRTVLSRGTRVSAQVSGDEIHIEGSFRGEALGRYIRVETSGEVDA